MLSAVYESRSILADGSSGPTPAAPGLPVRQYYIHHPFHLFNVILCVCAVCLFIADDLDTGAQTTKGSSYIPVFLPDGSSSVGSGILNVSTQVGSKIHSTTVLFFP